MVDEIVYSKNKRAEKLLGFRDVKGATVIINSPAEMGYRCPVCLNKPDDGVNFDERLEWSEYNTFLWCPVCNFDYPTCLCCTDIDKAINIYLKCIEEAKRAKLN